MSEEDAMLHPASVIIQYLGKVAFCEGVVVPPRSDEGVGIYGADVFGGGFFAELKIFQHRLYPRGAVAVEFYFQNEKTGERECRTRLVEQFVHRGVGHAAQVQIEGEPEVVFGVEVGADEWFALVNDVDHRAHIAAQDLVEKTAGVVVVAHFAVETIKRYAFKQLKHNTVWRTGTVFQNRPFVFALDFHEHGVRLVALIVAAQAHFHTMRNAIYFGMVHLESRRVEVDAAHGVSSVGLHRRETVGTQEGQHGAPQSIVLFYRDEIFEFVAHCFVVCCSLLVACC